MIELLENINLEGFTAVIPSVSVGNVGQLASDLLISSLYLKKIGFIWHPSVLPLAGADPYGRTNSPSTGCELYVSTSLKVLICQIRSAVTKTRHFVDDLTNWLKSNKVRRVVILAGSSAHERKDQQLGNVPVRYLFCPLTSAEESKNAKSRNWIELENKDLSGNKSLTYIPGSGLTVKLFNNCMRREIPCSILLNFCSDGDNIPDAFRLVDYFNEWFQLKEKQNLTNWIVPPSWNLFFGANPPVEIFN
ncbi:hypothetical protein RUM43_000763 [Polyplax serrata]|uniref:Proteasome assembly chaperone 2 n=1 Tax=Polyplax serrata TaxID=468196 RepID=A0AAN8SEU1_POLSC